MTRQKILMGEFREGNYVELERLPRGNIPARVEGHQSFGVVEINYRVWKACKTYEQKSAKGNGVEGMEGVYNEMKRE